MLKEFVYKKPTKTSKILGWVKNKSNFFSNIDLCYFNNQEYCTLPLIEAINYMKPIIAIQNIATEEIIKHQYNGIIVPNDSEKLAEELANLWANEKLAQQYSIRAFHDSYKKLNPMLISEKLVNCLNES